MCFIRKFKRKRLNLLTASKENRWVLSSCCCHLRGLCGLWREIIAVFYFLTQSFISKVACNALSTRWLFLFPMKRFTAKRLPVTRYRLVTEIELHSTLVTWNWDPCADMKEKKSASSAGYWCYASAERERKKFIGPFSCQIKFWNQQKTPLFIMNLSRMSFFLLLMMDTTFYVNGVTTLVNASSSQTPGCNKAPINHCNCHGTVNQDSGAINEWRKFPYGVEQNYK